MIIDVIVVNIYSKKRILFQNKVPGFINTDYSEESHD